MKAKKKIQPTIKEPIWESTLFTLSLVIFGLLTHYFLPGALFFLGCGGVIMARHSRNPDRLVQLLGLQFKREKFWTGLLAGLSSGILAALIYGLFSGRTWEGYHLTHFALTAALIGLTEELVFRGYLQSCLDSYGSTFSILFTALAHTLYKMALFLPFPTMHIGWIALWTLGAGLVLGLLRVYFRNILPAALNHALFDVLVYGNRARALWWVW